MKHIRPYPSSSKSKKEQVEEMFDNISGKYDVLNRLLSFKIDVRWRKKLIQRLGDKEAFKLIDIATGTGDLAIEIAKQKPNIQIIGFDLSQKMLEIGKKKIEKAGLSNQIEMMKGDAENMPFEDASFDMATVAFGVRNFENLDKGLLEINRVLKPNGLLLILEFSKPKGWFAPIFNFYFKFLLPKIGKLISKDAKAYSYLYDSAKAFPEGENLKNFILNCNFARVQLKRLTFGVVTIYECTK